MNFQNFEASRKYIPDCRCCHQKDVIFTCWLRMSNLASKNMYVQFAFLWGIAWNVLTTRKLFSSVLGAKINDKELHRYHWFKTENDLAWFSGFWFGYVKGSFNSNFFIIRYLTLLRMTYVLKDKRYAPVLVNFK